MGSNALMTVGDLIQRLQEFDSSLPVVTGGFDEAGIEDIQTIKLINVDFFVRKGCSHIGPHEESLTGSPAIWIDF